MYSIKNIRYPSSYLYKDLYDDSKKVKEKDTEEPLAEEEGMGKVSELLGQAEAIKKSIEENRKNQTNLYDATMDLMAIESAEQEPRLKAIQVRLMFKMRTVKASGAKSSEVQAAVNKIKKVLGKLKTKIKKLKEEEGIEKKRENARRARQRRMEEKLRRELEVKRAIRKKRERKDVEESRMGMGANYGGPTGSDPVSMQDFGVSGITADSSLMDLMMGDSELSVTAAAAIGAVAEGAVAGDAGMGSIDVSL